MNSCGNECPHCTCKCEKKLGHSRAGYDGIAGLCWCPDCQEWWIEGEPTLLCERGVAERI